VTLWWDAVRPHAYGIACLNPADCGKLTRKELEEVVSARIRVATLNRHWVDAIVANASLIQTKLTLGRATPAELAITDFLTWPMPEPVSAPVPVPDDRAVARGPTPDPSPETEETRRRLIRKIQMMGAAWVAANNGA
jgi:hypothetical protein